MYACIYTWRKRTRKSARALVQVCVSYRARERETERERASESERENKQPCFAIIVVICAKETPTTYSGTIPVSKISVSFFKISKFQPRGRHFSSFAK